MIEPSNFKANHLLNLMMPTKTVSK